MNSFFDTLNLRPQERRIIVVIAVIVFVVLNLLLVWPHFNDWGRLMVQLAKTRHSIEDDQKEIALNDNVSSGYEHELRMLLKKESNNVLMSEQIQLSAAVLAQAKNTGVMINSSAEVPSTRAGTTNEFFDERSLKIVTESDEVQLVKFLVNVGTDSAMIRVRELDLKPVDNNRYKLRATITLTANYQKSQKKPAEPAPTKSTARLPQKGPGPTPAASKPPLSRPPSAGPPSPGPPSPRPPSAGQRGPLAPPHP